MASLETKTNTSLESKTSTITPIIPNTQWRSQPKCPIDIWRQPLLINGRDILFLPNSDKHDNICKYSINRKKFNIKHIKYPENVNIEYSTNCVDPDNGTIYIYGGLQHLFMFRTLRKVSCKN